MVVLIANHTQREDPHLLERTRCQRNATAEHRSFAVMGPPSSVVPRRAPSLLIL